MVMVNERNRAWLPVLMPQLEGDVVVVVGAAHLPGTVGIVASLKDVGCRVEPLMLPAKK
jgi:uncharacterized protein YbaP (TraB family)